MSNREDITIEQIKDKIRRSLTERKALIRDLGLIKDENPIGNKNSVSSSQTFKEKFINYGLMHKNIIKKIPLLYTVAKKLYHSLLIRSENE